VVRTADPTAAAFFDLDNTVVRGASIFQLARGLHRRGLLTGRQLLGAAYKEARFRLAGVEHAGHVASTRAEALAFIAGRRVVDLEALGEEVFDESLPRGSGPAPARSRSPTSTAASPSGW
jgi:phosphoserine phosphatase